MNALIKAVSIIILVGLLFMVSDNVSMFLRESLDEYDDFIGDEIILNKDTLMIINYSFILSNFTLEDGRVIKYSLLDKKEIIKH